MNRRLAIFVSDQVSSEYLTVCKILQDTFHWDIMAITTCDEGADMTRTVLPVDRVYKVRSHLHFFQKEEIPLSDIVYDYRPHLLLMLGIPVRRVRRLVSQMTVPVLGVHLVQDKDTSMGDVVTQEIYPSFIPNISFSQSEISVPPPCPYRKSSEVNTFQLFCYGDKEQQMAVYDIAQSLGIEIAEDRDQASVSVFLDNLDFDLFGFMIEDMARGNIVIAPRLQTYLDCLGKGGLFYQQYSLSELQACCEIVQRSAAKREQLRYVLAEMYHKQYAHHAIAERWHRIFRNQCI